MARSLWPESSGATQREQRVEVGREIDVHIGDDPRRVLAAHAVRRARPRPLASRRSTCTWSSSWARRVAIAHVPSVLALSAMVITQVWGKHAPR